MSKTLRMFPWLALAAVAPTSADAQLEWSEQHPGLAPAPRYGHAMARNHPSFAPTLFGGTDGTQFFGDTWTWFGGVWTRESNTGPTPRADHAMTEYHFTDDSMLLFGGRDAQGKLLGDTWIWDGTAWHPSPPGTAPSPRAGHAMTPDVYEIKTMILFGGRTDSGLSDETWMFVDGVWSPVPTATRPPAREGHSLLWIPLEEIGASRFVLFGGHDGNRPLDDVWQFNGTDWVEVTHHGALSGRTGQAAVVGDFWRRRPLTFGGRGDALLDDTLERLATGPWVSHPTVGAPSARDESAIALDWGASHAQYMLFGGRDQAGNALGDTWILKPLTLPLVEEFGEGCGQGAWSLTGGPNTFTSPLAILGDQVDVSVFTSLPGIGVLFFGHELGVAPVGCGLHVAPTHVDVARLEGGSGTFFAHVQFHLPFDPTLVGSTVAFQAFATDRNQPGGFGISRAVRMTLAE